MTKNRKISVLLAEDEQTLAMIIKDTLDAQDFNITPAADGEEALRLFLARKPDVLVADVMMPHMDGYTFCRTVKDDVQCCHIPFILLTARSSVEDVVKGFELGANDYLKKPFGMQELIVRLRALMGRAAHYRPEDRPVVPSPTIGISRYRLDAVRQQLLFAGQTVPLSHRETELLRMLAERRNDVVETHDILLKLWGDDSFFNARSLQVFITKLRHKLAKDDSIRIVNVRGIGYKLLF